MLHRFKLRLAMQFDHPLFRLLVLDWRFSCLLFLLLATIFAAVAFPLRFWKRTPPGFAPEIRISLLDFIQSHTLARSAQKAEKLQDLHQALLSWGQAFANDPCNQQIAAHYVQALLRSKERADIQQGLQVALWLQNISPTPSSYHLVIAAAERNEDWDLIISAQQLLGSGKSPPEVQASILRALFRSARYGDARHFLRNLTGERAMGQTSDLYLEALNCILTPNVNAADCARLQAHLEPGSHNIEAFEIYLITCAEKRDLPEFQNALKELRQITDNTLPFDALHIRLLLRLGRWQEAREVAARFRAPRSGRETFEIADTLVAVGDREGATVLLAGYRSEFEDSTRHLVLYARLLLQQGRRKELTIFRKELQEHPSAPASDLLMRAITCCVETSESARKSLFSALDRLPIHPSSTELSYFAAETLLATGHPRAACQVLLRIEPQHLDDSAFYSKLFAMAEASKDAVLMRGSAERAYQLAPGDLRVVANHAAMLIMCEEQSDRALALTALCVKANPDSLPARINHAAALINSEQFGPADLILRSIDESALPDAALNQLRFIRLKRAAKLGDKNEILRLAPLLDKSTLYSVQLGWLAQNSI